MSELLTVGLPFFNNATTILSSVRSVLAQSFEDWKLILLDDGSTDGSLDLVRQIDEPRIVVISDGRNTGLATRLNQLADRAASPFLARMDADDMMHPHRLEYGVAALEANSAPGLVFSDAISVDAYDNPTGYRRSLIAPSLSSYFRSSPYIHPTLLAQTEWFRSHRYDPSYRRCQDQELWVRTLGQQPVVSVGKPLLYLREAGTVSAAKYATSMQGTRRVLHDHGRERLGRAQMNMRIAETFIKQGAYSAADRLGQADRLVRSRATPLSASEKREHSVTLEMIGATPVPGIDR